MCSARAANLYILSPILECFSQLSLLLAPNDTVLHVAFASIDQQTVTTTMVEHKVPRSCLSTFFQPVSHAIACNITASLNMCSLEAPMPHCWLRPLPTLAPDSSISYFAKTHAMPGIFPHTVHTTNATTVSLGIAAYHSSKIGMGVNISASVASTDLRIILCLITGIWQWLPTGFQGPDCSNECLCWARDSSDNITFLPNLQCL